MTTVPRPSGTVTFLFTDIEGSTRRWEADPDTMRAALAAHDDVLRHAIESHSGWLFKHTGDGVVAAFASAPDGVAAAIDAQRALQLPVRMGVGTGAAEHRGDDYFGPALNRAARVMAAGHGGQILLAATTASLVDGVDLVDLGEHRLRDLSGAQRLFQVRADGLPVEFPPLRTLDAVPGNLPLQATSFVGREVESADLAKLVRTHRLVTLTGVGGVGKTRLAVQVAAELLPDFDDGAWLVELAPVGDPAAVPDSVASALGIIQQQGRTVTESLAESLAGRRMLIVLDNCEHVLDAAADLVEAILARASTVKVLATSREGLRASAEHLWPVPSLDVEAGTDSGAVELFVERAAAVRPEFTLADPADATAVTEICRRLDGIALAIELAAARMVSMTARDLRDRLGERFRLLSGSRRGLERHQTLRQTVQWSYDLLNDDERAVLGFCSVFAGGFDLAAATAVCDHLDEYSVLDLLDSLVRKSLVTLHDVAGHARYGLLETIRQFAEDQLAATGGIDEARRRHGDYFGSQSKVHWAVFMGPQARVAMEWIDVEFDNLRAAFRFATDQGHIDTATAVAAHTAVMAVYQQRFEPIAWAEELLPTALTARAAQLPRLYTAAAWCFYLGRHEATLSYAEAAAELEPDPFFDGFEPGWNAMVKAIGQFMLGRLDRYLETFDALVPQPGFAHVAGLCGLLYQLPAAGRLDDALAIAEETVTAARALGVAALTPWALFGCGRALSPTDPVRALAAMREGLELAREQRMPLWDAQIGREAALLEAVHGDFGQAVEHFDTALDSCWRSGDVVNLAGALAAAAIFFDHFERPEVAATVYGTSAHLSRTTWVLGLDTAIDHARSVLGAQHFDDCVATGATMEPAEAVRYTRAQLRLVTPEQGRSS